MLDFNKIIAGVAGQRETFEELVCQIARRSPPSGHSEFRRIHGAGGDGGVEAVWILNNGDEHGYQAKFYTKSGDVDWSAIDKSVEAALATHPRLTTMTIAVACSLTGRTQRVTKAGRPQANGWDAWDDHKAKWEASAKALRRKVSFEPWTAPDLEDMLARPEMAGLIDYWFGEIELSPTWLKAQCQRTVAGLEERYHPEDHVDVSTAQLFDGLLRNSRFCATLKGARDAVLEQADFGVAPKSLPADQQQKLIELTQQLGVFNKTTAVLEAATDAPFDYPTWRDQVASLGERVLEIVRPASKLARALAPDRTSVESKKAPEENRDHTELTYLIEALQKLQSALAQFVDVSNQLGCLSDERRFALLDGRAGSGKSHLIASQIELAVAEGAAALFVLGTNFTLHGTIENQLLAYFELGARKFDQLLGALNAHAEASGVRALIAIDAVNEGAGVQLWRGALQAFAQRVLAFPNLALCISCRREYIDRLVTSAVTDMVARADIAGFETPEEIEAAAQVYMDRRGIVRPATPWLNPEFSNPLFLRTACLALERDGRTTFPRGMRGTSEVLNFFLETTGRHLGTDYDGADTLVLPVRRALLALAGLMATSRQDFVARTQAHVAVEAAFQGLAPTPGKTWLELMRFRGLLRYDPNPAYDPADPLSDQEDVVRFSFQRFQDHLIANFLLQDVKDPTGLFAPGGTLAFVLGKHGVEWAWRGLFYALCLHCADRYRVELVDLLPGGSDKWWDEWAVQDAFVESVRWRTGDAFSPRSLALLNQLNLDDDDVIALLVELGAVENHAWNAEFLDRNLTLRKLPDRDAFWTRRINGAHNDANHSLSRLIGWCMNPGISRAEDGALGLTLILLGWACASTSNTVRDTATKAMTRIFLERPLLIEPLFERLAPCDDPYVVERLFGALYGASLRTLDPQRLRAHALIAWAHAFSTGRPPIHIVTRDYARGVVELAQAVGALDASIDLARCRPPYGASAPVFNVTEARVEARSKRVGADSILMSCYQGLADFGRYTLENRVERFAAAALSGPRPLTAAETGQAFFDDVSKDRPDIAQAFETLRDAHRRKRVVFHPLKWKTSTPAADQRQVSQAEAAFLSLLTPAQVKRYRTDAEQWAAGTDRDWIVPGKGVGKEVDAHRAKLWVANRAIAYGWTEKRFPHDQTRGERHNERGRIERIGKKYQHIAMMELLARLADNNWLKPYWGVPAKAYDNLVDVEFLRGIEPSILPADVEAPTGQGIPNVPPLRYENLPANARQAWVSDPQLAPEKLALAHGSDLGDKEWLTLYRFASHDIDMPRAKRSMDVPWQQSEFYFLTMVLTPSNARERFIDETSQNEDDFHDWLPGEYTDGPYIGELGRRSTWPSEPWSKLDARGSKSPRQYDVIRPTVSYHWESHLDKGLADGFSRQVPIPWLISKLGLNPDSGNVGVYTDARDVPIIVSGRQNHHRYVLVRRDALLEMARQHDLEPVWTIIGERIALTDNSRRTPDVRVRYNGLLWLDEGQPHLRHWSRPD